MRLWEALEKSNVVRRSCWGDDVKDLDISVREVITTADFLADDWEPVVTHDMPEALKEKAKLEGLAQPLRDYLCEEGTPWDAIIITQEGMRYLRSCKASPFDIRKFL